VNQNTIIYLAFSLAIVAAIRRMPQVSKALEG
jgi:hypothetical protein